MPKPIVLFTDLDRTLLPNGPQEFSPTAYEYLQQLQQQDVLTIIYVSGRHQALIEEAISQYHPPLPDYIIADVGTTIYLREHEQWVLFDAWQQHIAADWNGLTREDVHECLKHHEALALQEAEKQNQFKLSYYCSLAQDETELVSQLQQTLQQSNVQANVIYSIDEIKRCGLIDVLPMSANKLHAILFLLDYLNQPLDQCLFSGDSGNDLDVLVSNIPSVLVANAMQQVKAEAMARAGNNRSLHQLYIAKGDCLQMNGCYAAGIVEGLLHFYPHLAPLLTPLQ
ncbi:MAG: HAD-IIB family hydrolase [Gammaproteobacteria bacterium]|nr:HAD-IIB family hydrolase [Gammaproteobacteria bacterium]MDH5729118.1 HAD-IIB family hydrolase [Gammaproteobacteria bacterium]